MKIAVLDDYQQVAREFADFSALEADHDVRIFHEHLGDRDAVVAALAEFDVIAAMRERTVFDRATLERLPNLKFMVTTGNRNASIDMDCLKERGIPCASTGGRLQTTPELAWGLILAVARNIPLEDRNVREGRWQTTIGRPARALPVPVMPSSTGARSSPVPMRWTRPASSLDGCTTGSGAGSTPSPWAVRFLPTSARRTSRTPTCPPSGSGYGKAWTA